MKKMNKEEFKAFLNKCYEDLQVKQKHIAENYRLMEYERYIFDNENRKIKFKSSDIEEVEFEFVCIGSFNESSKTWMWAWANPSLPYQAREDSIKLNELKGITETPIFNNPGFQCDEIMAYETVAICVEHLGAMGMFKMPGKGSDLFLALMKKI